MSKDELMKDLTADEQSFFDALLKLKKPAVQRLIESLNKQFNLSGEGEADSDEGEKEVVKKTSFKLFLEDKGDEAKTKIRCVRVFQSLFPDKPISQAMAMFVVGEIDKEFLTEQEALDAAKKFNDLGDGLKVKVI